MTEKPKHKLPGGQVVKWREQDYPTVYANIMGLGMTPFDISIIFGEIGDSTATEVIGIPRVKLLLSAEQAANLAKILGIGLKAFVDGNGPLRLAGALNVEEFNNQINTKIGNSKIDK